jgi:hypothetical protein
MEMWFAVASSHNSWNLETTDRMTEWTQKLGGQICPKCRTMRSIANEENCLKCSAKGKKRSVTLSDDELSRLNHLRERGGAEPLPKQMAEEFLSKTTSDVYNMTMDRIRS